MLIPFSLAMLAVVFNVGAFRQYLDAVQEPHAVIAQVKASWAVMFWIVAGLFLVAAGTQIFEAGASAAYI